MYRRMIRIGMHTGTLIAALAFSVGPAVAAGKWPAGIGFNSAVDYDKPNYANSPVLRKFVDSLPGLGAANKNNLGQYIPVAVPDTTKYPGSDYYEIGLKDYQEKMHSDLPLTKLRGYYQINTADPAVAASRYLGPLIVAQRDRPVRVKFVNQLGTGVQGDLFLPVDTTVMGAGMGPQGGEYSQNRATIHLHGLFGPWISDGTPHQWITPAGDPTVYKKGVSFQNVPDMVGPGKSVPAPAAGDGIATFYWPNQQSARLQFYHDHAYGITRLNVYAGEAAGYLIRDPVEAAMIGGGTVSGVSFAAGTVPAAEIPLVIQDKTFVNDATTPPHASFAATGGTKTPFTLTVDPLWKWGGGGSLWFPHEYIPNQNIFDPAGANPMGRWDYGPWISPPILATFPVLPSPSIVPEAFMDTMVVNGTAFPYVTVQPQAYRFRILNACNDRILNLQLYTADPAAPTEVKMVPAIVRSNAPTWPSDGRDGGVPDPAGAGPSFYQIGSEGGILPAVAVIDPQPVNYDYDRRSATFGSVKEKALLMVPAERADVIVDFSQYAGKTLILYNDAPAPMPAFDTRYDYFTGDPDQTAVGGAPSSKPGFGPNTRTIMQIRVADTEPAPEFDLVRLQAALPKAYKLTQPPPVVPEAAYNTALGTNYTDKYVSTWEESLNLTGSPQPIAKINTLMPGAGYTTPPTVVIVGGNPTPGAPAASATATLNGVSAVTITTAGSGYTAPPTVTFKLPAKAVGGPVPAGTGAKAVATISGGSVVAITVTDPGSGYTVTPLVTLTGGGGVGATATAAIVAGGVASIKVTNAGSFTTTPLIYLTGGGGTGATASAILNGATPFFDKLIIEMFDRDYGRMNAMFGAVPTITPTGAIGVPVPFGPAFYVDPPSEIMTVGQPQIWRFLHQGVDTHSIHFHHMNVQVVNRVDWSGVQIPPDPNELGWKETVRMDPLVDVILAIRPEIPDLPFQVPRSKRLLDVTTPAGSTANFSLPPALIAPGAGAGAQAALLGNRVTDFGWEYVWHCHLLGHEENDMMRPLVLEVPAPAAPASLTVTAGPVAPRSINLAWAYNAAGEKGFIIYRATNSTFTAGLKVINVGWGVKKYTDADTLTGGTTYFYKVMAWNTAGNSIWSNIASFKAPAGVPPGAAPKGLAAGAITRTSVALTWADTNTSETAFVIQRATDPAFTVGLVTATVKKANLALYTRKGLKRNTSYYFRVAAQNANGNGPWSNVVTAKTLP